MYDYEKELTEQIKKVVREEYFDEMIEKLIENGTQNYKEFKQDLFDWLYDELWENPRVINTPPGVPAEECLAGNYGLIADAFDQFGYSKEIADDPEKIDTMIRYHLLFNCLWDIMFPEEHS